MSYAAAAAAAKSLQSCPTLSDPMMAAHQAPPSMGFSRQEYWSGVSLPSPKMSYKHLITTYEIQNFKYICAGYKININ